MMTRGTVAAVRERRDDAQLVKSVATRGRYGRGLSNLDVYARDWWFLPPEAQVRGLAMIPNHPSESASCFDSCTLWVFPITKN